MTLVPGTRLGTYEIIGPLGAGGMGEVYRARDSRLERDVAIKALPAAVARDDDRLARFRLEAKVVAQLNHPHIAQIHQLLEHEGGTYLVLEYVPGAPLTDRIRSRDGLETGEALRLGAQIARALEAAHARGVVHRDLKPGNVMVTPDGTAKVLDFGLAVQATAPGSADSGTRTSTGIPSGGVHGTPGYMAPEQVRGEDVDARADIWAFGCLLYECLAGTPAVRGRTHAELHAATLHAEPELGRLPESLPEPVRVLLRRCLTRDLGRRQQSMGDARLALQEALGVAPATPAVPGAATANPNNLPRDMSHFIGREAQLAELAAGLDEDVLITLTGSGGSGKTRLSTELGRRVLGRFDGGIWLAELAPISDPELVAPIVAAAFGVEHEVKRPLAETVAEYLKGRKTLLILDNCEHVLESATELTQALLRSVPGLRVVATSREPLGVAGERAYRVPSLTLPDTVAASIIPRKRATPHRGTPTSATPGGRTTPATPAGPPVDMAPLLASESVTFFVDRARGVRPAFELNESNAAAVADICRRLDGIPLAIELAAARIRLLSPEQILSKLDDRFRLLTGGGRGVMERQRTLRAAVDWSYKLLTPSERRMFRTLSAFAGGWTLESAVAVCGPGGGDDGANLDEFEVLDVLTHLADKSLIMVDDSGEEPRYRFLETVRQYASEELDREDETTDTRDRHLNHFYEWALDATGRGEFFTPVPAAWMRRFAPEAEDILEAMSWARTGPAWTGDGLSRVSRGLRLGERLQHFWAGRGLNHPACRALDALLARGGEADPELVAHAMYVVGILTTHTGDLTGGLARLNESLLRSRKVGSRTAIGRCVNGIGTVHVMMGEPEKAKACFEEALSLSRLLGDPRRIAGGLQNLSLVMIDDRERRRALTQEALELFRGLDDPNGIGDCLNNLGIGRLQVGEYGAARDLFEEALHLHRLTFDMEKIASVGAMVGACRGRLGDTKGAIASFSEAVGLLDRGSDPVAVLNLVQATAPFATEMGEADRALRYLSADRMISTAMGLALDSYEQAYADSVKAEAGAALRAATGSDEAAERAEAEGRAFTLESLHTDVAAWVRGLAASADRS